VTSEELRRILEGDDSGLLDTPEKVKPATLDERLKSSFDEINVFVAEVGREPNPRSTSVHERRLASRLDGLRRNPEKIDSLHDLDVHNILIPIKRLESVSEILAADDPILVDPVAEDLMTIRHVPVRRGAASYIARQHPCDDFELFEHLFRSCHEDLRSGTKSMRELGSEQQIQEGEFFLLRGQLVYVAALGEIVEVAPRRHDARLRVIYENGTESDLFRRSLAKNVRSDGRRIIETNQPTLADFEIVEDRDVATGHIYVLRSLSSDPVVSSIDDLYKIGFTTRNVEERIRGAEQDATYFRAPVEVVASYRCLNMDPQKLEHLLHRTFNRVRLQTEIVGDDGLHYSADEWFVVPFKVIDEAIQLIVSGEIVHYVYDDATEELVER
jgi:hypothetical protein